MANWHCLNENLLFQLTFHAIKPLLVGQGPLYFEFTCHSVYNHQFNSTSSVWDSFHLFFYHISVDILAIIWITLLGIRPLTKTLKKFGKASNHKLLMANWHCLNVNLLFQIIFYAIKQLLVGQGSSYFEFTFYSVCNHQLQVKNSFDIS